MICFTRPIILACLLALTCNQKPAAAQEKETRYLAFQIFTYGPDPKIPTMGEGTNPQPARFPDKATLRDYIEDIKQRIGIVGGPQTRLAVMLGQLSFDHGDAETTRFIELGFELALETDVAVGFHIDDSMFWAQRKDLLSDPNNVEAVDWDGTPSTGRRLNWGRKPSQAPPQMCFNSKAIQQEVRQRSALLGRAIAAGVKQLQQRNRPELFAGVIAGSETMIGQDFQTGKYLGYRALLNRGFSRQHPPQDMDLELEKVVQEFIELWTTGLAGAGVSPQKIYSHTAFLSRRAFGLGDNKAVTYMQHDSQTTYSQHNHSAPPSVAFGKTHRPGFSTYPQPGLFDDIYEQLDKHQQTGWASCEGTNMQPATGPGQSGMNMETYLAKMFNHGGTLVNIFAWGIGGPAMKNLDFRLVTQGEDALQAYRKFLRGEPLIEMKTDGVSLMERLPAKIHKIQNELPAWIEKADAGDKQKIAALMQKLQEQLKAKNLDEVEKTADAILKMRGASEPAPVQNNLEDAHQRLSEKVERVKEGVKKWADSGRDPSVILKTMQEKVGPLLKSGKVKEAEAELDHLLEQLRADGKGAQSSNAPAEAAPHAAGDIPEDVRSKLTHRVGSSFLVFRHRVHEELKLTREQIEKLDQHLRELLPQAVQVFQKSKGERDKYNQKTHEEMAAVLKEILNEGQRTRLRQLERQRDGLFGGESWKELQVTDEQRKQFMPLIQQTQKETGALMEEIHKGANADEIRPRVLKLRSDLEVQLEALLTDAQKTQWKEMLGKPVDLGVLFDGV